MRIFERCEAWNSISSKKLFLQNAVNALNFEKNQIQNFFKQKARLEVSTFFLFVYIQSISISIHRNIINCCHHQTPTNSQIFRIKTKWLETRKGKKENLKMLPNTCWRYIGIIYITFADCYTSVTIILKYMLQ